MNIFFKYNEKEKSNKVKKKKKKIKNPKKNY